MNILVAANDTYMFPLKVMLTSFLETNSDETHHIYLLYNAMSEVNVRDICEYVSGRYSALVIPTRICADEFCEFPISHHFSVETYYRFLAQKIVPNTEDRVLWLDADMIVKGSLKSFYYQSFDGKSLIVCKSVNKNPQALLDKLQCPPGTVYFNAGLILFNLNMLRNVSLADYYQYFKEHEAGITWLDQDILNGMYALKTKFADYVKYNFQFFSTDVFTKEEQKQIKTDTVILHYIGSVKPWHSQYDNPLSSYFLRYAKKVWPFRSYIMFRLNRFHIQWRSCTYPLRRLHGYLHEWNYLRKKRPEFKEKFGKMALLVGTPDHLNIGDSAIVVAEAEFLRRCGIAFVEMSASECRDYLPTFRPKTTVFFHGGGNMGNQWLLEEQLRRDLLAKAKDKPAVIFPQTVYYSKDNDGEREKLASVSFYNNKKNLFLVAREKISLDLLAELYPNTPRLLTPDIVLSATMDTFGVKPGKREGVLLCMRSDAERAMSEAERDAVVELLEQRMLCYRKTDMYTSGQIVKENRLAHVRSKMEEFTASELVITDRLHGMVFAAITETPCIVLSNYNHKVRGTYEWIKYLPYIRYAQSVADVEKYLPELLEMESCVYDNTPLRPYFDQLAKVVKEYAND